MAASGSRHSHQYGYVFSQDDARVHMGDHHDNRTIFQFPTGTEGLIRAVNPFSTVPFPRDADFINRKSLMKEIETKLGQPAGRAALVGLGGIGKSQLAIEYAYRLREDQPDTFVFWIFASDTLRFEHSMRTAVSRLKLRDRDGPYKDLLEAFRDWLCDPGSHWCLIVDNADDINVLHSLPSENSIDGMSRISDSERLLDYLSVCEHGCMLITTRNRAAAHKIVSPNDVIPVPAMDERQAVAMVKQKLGYWDKNASDADAWATDAVNIPPLAEAPDFIPLALAQAATHIRHRSPRFSVRKYLEKIEESSEWRSHLLSRCEEDRRRDRNAKNAIFLTWEISFEYVLKTSPSAADLLSLMCFLDRSDIPHALVRTYTKRRFDLDDDIKDLSTPIVRDEERYIGKGKLAVEHDRPRFQRPVTYQQTREGRDKGTYSVGGNEASSSSNGTDRLWRNITTWAAPAMRAIQPEQSPPHSRERYQSHVSDYASDTEQDDGKYSDDERSSISDYSSSSSDGDNALSAPLIPETSEDWINYMALIEEDIVTLREFAFVSVTLDPDVYEMHRLVQLAMQEWLRSNLRFEHWQQQVLDVLGAAMVGPLSTSKTSQVAFPHAKATMEWHVQQPRALLKKARLLHHSACSALQNGQSADSRNMAKHSVDIMSKLLGKHNRETLESMRVLAEALVKLGDFQAAEKLQVKVLSEMTAFLGETDESTVRSMKTMARIHEHRARFEEAARLLIRVFELTREKAGKDHLDTLQAMHSVAIVFEDLGDVDRTQRLYEKTWNAHRRVLGKGHHETIRVMYHLARFNQEHKRWSRAKYFYRRMLEIQGLYHPERALTMENLAKVMKEAGQTKSPLLLMQESAEVSARILGTDNETTKERGRLADDWLQEYARNTGESPSVALARLRMRQYRRKQSKSSYLEMEPPYTPDRPDTAYDPYPQYHPYTAGDYFPPPPVDHSAV